MVGITAAYKLLVDFDQDGFFCEGVLSTDPLNLIVGARQKGLNWAGLHAYEDFYYERYRADFDRGVWVYRAVQPSTAPNAGLVGTGIAWGGGKLDPDATPNDASIAVSPSTEYSLSFEVMVVEGDLSVEIHIWDQDDNLLEQVADSQTLGVWEERTHTFTTEETTTYIKINVVQAIDASDKEMLVRGLLLVEGDTLPTVWNAGDATNVQDDVTAYLESVTWQHGIVNYSDAISQPASFKATLNNLSGDWSPENPSSPFYPIKRGFLVKLYATYNAVDYVLYQGVMESLQIAPGLHGKRRATLILGDPLRQLGQTDYKAPLQLAVTTDEVLQALFDAGTIIYPYRGHYWMVGVEGASELSTTAIVFLEELSDLDVGDSTYAYAGDLTDSPSIVSAETYLREYVYAELGGWIIWHPPSLQFRFYSRSHYIRNEYTPIELPMIELDEPPEYVWGDDLRNWFTVSYYPRKVGTPASVLYAMGNLPLQLSTDTERRFTIRYSTPTAPDANTAALDQIVPVSGTDYIANAAADGSGASKTTALTVVVTYYATKAEVYIKNNDAGTVYLTTFQLRGTPLTSFNRETVDAVDGESIIDHGEYRRTVELAALDDAEVAADYANVLLQRYKQPFGRLGGVSVWGNRTTENMERVLGIDIGDVVEAYDEVAMNEATLYIVKGVRHTLSAGLNHWTRYFLEPLDRSIFWILGDAELSLLEQTTRLSL